MAFRDMESRHTPSILWFAPSYGYGRDLMYYGEIFRALREVRPRMSVAVERDHEYDNPYDIDLRPMFRLSRVPHTRKLGGVEYDATITIPRPDVIVGLTRMAPDALVLIEFTPLTILATLATKFSRKTARLLLVESDPETRGGVSKGPMLALKRWVVRQAHAIQTNNAAGARYLVETLGAPREKVLIRPYLTSRPPGLDGAGHDPKQPVRILFANTLNQRKNATVLLDALAACPADVRANVALQIVGDGPLAESVRNRAADLHDLASCSISSAVSYRELGYYYAQADALAITTRADYRSLSGFEGLGYGLALLASKADGASAETVIEGETGFLLDPMNYRAWAAAITELVRNREMLMAMQAASKQLYERCFSLQTISHNIAAGADLAIARRSENRIRKTSD